MLHLVLRLRGFGPFESNNSAAGADYLIRPDSFFGSYKSSFELSPSRQHQHAWKSEFMRQYHAITSAEGALIRALASPSYRSQAAAASVARASVSRAFRCFDAAQIDISVSTRAHLIRALDLEVW